MKRTDRTKMPRLAERTLAILWVWTVRKRNYEVVGTTDSCLAGIRF